MRWLLCVALQHGESLCFHRPPAQQDTRVFGKLKHHTAAPVYGIVRAPLAKSVRRITGYA